MTVFLRLLKDEYKADGLAAATDALRAGEADPRIFDVEPKEFEQVPAAPFAYWVSSTLRSLFSQLHRFETIAITRRGMATLDDFRFIRCYWEVEPRESNNAKWVPYSKGEENIAFYETLHSVANWDCDGAEVKSYVEQKVGSASRTVQSQDQYFKSGLTWVRRTFNLCVRILPANCIFSGGAQAIFPRSDTLATLALTLSSPFDVLTKLSAGRTGDAVQFEPGMLAKVPVPDLQANNAAKERLRSLALRGWSLKRDLDSVIEISHAFLLPVALRQRVGDYDRLAIGAELGDIRAEIDAIAFDLYGLCHADRAAILEADETTAENTKSTGEEQATSFSVPSTSSVATCALLSWAIGVAFGRFDWRLATGEREPPPEPDPFEALPAKSPGMLPDGAEPFHAHAGILADDPGHPHDLPRLIESVLERVDVPVPPGVRKWLQRDFFKEHLQQYSKSRRKAPIYWPLATASGSYTLWVYYPSLTSQTLYTAVNDFVEPKLKLVAQAVQALRSKAGRSGVEVRELERLQDLELELTDLRDSLLAIAPDYKPNHDDGVQITAAPLWPLFRHKPWQKVLKETWQKLEKGDYDWAHLAYTYWPERVREKCRTDKSLAIAHGLEELYEEPPEAPKKRRGKNV